MAQDGEFSLSLSTPQLDETMGEQERGRARPLSPPWVGCWCQAVFQPPACNGCRCPQSLEFVLAQHAGLGEDYHSPRHLDGGRCRRGCQP